MKAAMTLQGARPCLPYRCDERGSYPAWRRQIRPQQIVLRRVALVLISVALPLGRSASVGERVLGLGSLDRVKKLLVKSSRIPEGGPEDREQQVMHDVFQPGLPRPCRRFRFQNDAGCSAPANRLHASSARKCDVVVGREYGDKVSIPLLEVLLIAVLEPNSPFLIWEFLHHDSDIQQHSSFIPNKGR